MRESLILVVSFALVFISCAGDPPASSLGDTPQGQGPVVVFDLLSKPLPEVPLPNNVATRIDPSSPTGRYINIAKIAPTYLEQDLRAKADRLDGFASFAPITVSFDAPLNLANIVERHAKNDDPADDVMYLVDIDPDSPEFGRQWPLDIGSGNFPLVLEKRNNYFENDARALSSNILLEVVNEDINNNGVLDPGEDSDWDGVLDTPNYIDPTLSVSDLLPEGWEPGQILCTEENLFANEFPTYENLATFWEKETNTLIVRPVLPLRQGTLYAVLLTTRLVDDDGHPVRSPWPGKHHASQSEDLAALNGILPKLGLTQDEVAFAWTYTTSISTRELEWIRAGIYGHGKMAYLANEYPVTGFKLDMMSTEEDSPFYAKGQHFQAIIALVVSELADKPEQQSAIIDGYSNVGGVVMGTFTTPNFLSDKDGIATKDYPANDDEIFQIDPVTGDSIRGSDEVTWWCALPKRTEAHGNKPFKTVIYSHGYTSSRVETLGFAGQITRFGLAVCGLDAFGHGFELPGGTIDIGGEETSFKEFFTNFIASIGPLKYFTASLLKSRARDLDNDGDRDSGGDFWTADIFHTRDVVRQTIVDHMQFIRILRTFNGKRRWVYDTDGNGYGDLAGDMDGDGIVDLGGDSDNYYMMGGSLGGIITGVMAGIEPALQAAIPVVGGAGLMDIAIRSRQGGVPEAVFLPILGPFVVANPSDEGGVGLTFLVNNVNKSGKVNFALLSTAVPGDRVEVINTVNGEMQYAVIPSNRKFRIAIEGDALTASEKRPLLDLDNPDVTAPVKVLDTAALGDTVEIRLYDGDTSVLKDTVDTFEIDAIFQGVLYPKGAPLVLIAKGLALKRNSPELRRMMAISAMILEGGDPVRYAPHYDNPLNFDYDPAVKPGANVLVVPTVGDMNVPVNTGIQIARAAGFIELQVANPRFAGTKLEGKSDNRVLIDTFTVEGVECLPRWRNEAGEPVLFDVDDLDFGADLFGEPSLTTIYGVEPMRLTYAATHDEGGKHGLRLPLVERKGSHGFGTPDPTLSYDINNYMNNLAGYYFYKDGYELPDDPCLEDSSCTAEKNGISLPFGQADWEKKAAVE